MKRQDLEANGIYLNEEPAEAGSLPFHIDRLRSTLLDLRAVIPQRAGVKPGVAAENVKDTEIREGFERLDKGQDREAEWQDYYRVTFFEALAKEMNVRDEDSRR